MGTFVQDLRYGARALWKNPGFAAVAVLTLALGVGANAAIFSVLRAVVLRDLPYHDADRLVVMWTKNIRQNLPDGSSYLNFRDWKGQSKTFQDMSAFYRPEFTRGTLTDGSTSERIHLAQVGPGFFQLLGTPPLVGRLLQDADYSATPSSVVISHSLWQQRFGGDTQVIGRTIQLGTTTVGIIGVMPPQFHYPNVDIQLWQPLWFGSPQWQDERSRGRDSLVVIGRLATGATVDSARAEMDTIAARLREQYPASNASFGVLTIPFTETVIGATTERALWLLFGSVGFVLLIACANVANLVLARATARRNEYAVRAALGAGKLRLVRQALTENLVLALLAGAVGAGIAWYGTVILRNAAPGALPRAETIRLDSGVLLFLLAASIASGLLAALLPALQLSMTKPINVLREGGPRSHGAVARLRKRP